MRVVPVVVLEKVAYAAPLGDALTAGGIGCAEVTLRTDASLDVIAALSARRDMLIGAGTVLTTEQVDLARDAGAHFIVSPGLDTNVVARAQDLGIPVIPGVSTATEVQSALRLGVDHVKFFPAIPAGGLELIRAFQGPFPQVRFMPTGGITLETLAGFLGHSSVFAVGGSWMVPRSLLDAGDFATVERLTRDTVDFLATLPSK